MLAKDEAYEGRVLVVDDGQVAAPLHQMVLDTLDMIEKGYEAEQIRDLLERAGDRMMIYIALQTLAVSYTHLDVYKRQRWAHGQSKAS